MGEIVEGWFPGGNVGHVMKYARFLINNEIKYGIYEKDSLVELSGSYFNSCKKTLREYKIADVKLLAPCLPGKIVCVGLNYIDHAEELKLPVPDTPVLFIKPSSSVLNPEENIVYPAMSKQLDYEAELAVVIKAKAKNISEEAVEKYILGYTCFNDVTARDIQRQDVQWTRAKSFDTFSPFGPFIVSGINPDELSVEAYLNGELKQAGNTKNLIFKIKTLVSFISRVMTLFPGDIIATGTPRGVGQMKAGVSIEIVVEGIGRLRNYIIAE